VREWAGNGGLARDLPPRLSAVRDRRLPRGDALGDARTVRGAHRRREGCAVFGAIATPEWLDGKGLGDASEVLAPGPTLRELVDAGYLADFVCDARQGAEDALRSIRKVAGDFDQAGAAEAMMRLPVTKAAISDVHEPAASRRLQAWPGPPRRAGARPVRLICVELQRRDHYPGPGRRTGVPMTRAHSTAHRTWVTETDIQDALFALADAKAVAIARDLRAARSDVIRTAASAQASYSEVARLPSVTNFAMMLDATQRLARLIRKGWVTTERGAELEQEILQAYAKVRAATYARKMLRERAAASGRG
jgi:hypothetical protein